MEGTSSIHVLQNKSIQWIVSILIYVMLFQSFIWYHGGSYSLFITNKCVAIAAVFSIGFSIALGPLSRFVPYLCSLLPYRRTLGLTGAYMAIPHGMLSIFFLPVKFPLQWFQDHWYSIVFSAIAFLLFLVIASSSYPPGFKRLGKEKWLSLQRLVWPGLGVVLCHILLLGKIPGWITWLQTFDRPRPPGAFTTSSFILIVLLLKLADILRRTRKFK